MSDVWTTHYTPEINPDTSYPDTHQDTFSMRTLGFWAYLMTDSLLFGTLFCTYIVLHLNTFGGPSSQELFHISTAFSETMVLLFSSVACGLGLLAAKESKKNKTLFWLIVAGILGASFIALEINEFTQLVQEGHTWTKSAFLSSFFTLVGTHGLHVSFGLLWLGVMLFQLIALGITTDTFRRLVLFSLFWHFLDVIWIFIFTFVYLAGII